ncbi:MAG TPA: hypothetical protein DCZ00_04325 [Lactococcus sp.]|uniref:hypothetical protein n=1 Tax=Lactococcus TaxID=1357 RepID=UPI000E7E0222|nr:MULTISPECIES: hypothetical protein [Lactococcus]HAP15866.1 hypothetical protein [Lactococcus sp.]HBC90655.1 hypothetical protein [Lactococcus sp.]
MRRISRNRPLLYLGGAVIAAPLLRKTQSEDEGWLVIIIHWGLSAKLSSLVGAFFSQVYLNLALILTLSTLEELSLTAGLFFKPLAS